MAIDVISLMGFQEIFKIGKNSKNNYQVLSLSETLFISIVQHKFSLIESWKEQKAVEEQMTTLKPSKADWIHSKKKLYQLWPISKKEEIVSRLMLNFQEIRFMMSLNPNWHLSMSNPQPLLKWSSYWEGLVQERERK